MISDQEFESRQMAIHRDNVRNNLESIRSGVWLGVLGLLVINFGVWMIVAKI